MYDQRVRIKNGSFFFTAIEVKIVIIFLKKEYGAHHFFCCFELSNKINFCM